MKAIKGNIMIGGMAVLLAGLLLSGASAQDPSEGLVPTVRVGVPNLSNSGVKNLPLEFDVVVFAEDLDSSTGRPVKYRHLLVSAQYDTTATGEPRYIRTPFEYLLHVGKVLSWDDPNWSDWADYPAEDLPPTIHVGPVDDLEYYLLALQVMDADGAVSIAQDYQVEVLNFRARSGAFRPEVTLCETYLGCPAASIAINEIAGGQPLNFSWIADASVYGGTIASYRHGWDLIDPDDPNDPGWAVPPGLEPENLYAAERTFQDGIHVFTLRVEDNIGQVRVRAWQLMVIPFIDRSNQLELLVIDQTVDGTSNGWLDQAGQPRDNEVYRNAYWEFLANASGGVNGFNQDRDWLDDLDQVMYSDLVKYKAVLCFARFYAGSGGQTMLEQFRPVNGVDRFVWLAPYQFRGGNYFQVGDHSMYSFLESLNYMIPVIFDSHETTYVDGDVSYVLGFGQTELPDGSLVARGPRMYPYATAGIAALDWTSPNDKTIYARSTPARFDRKAECVGLKGLALDPDFRSHHAVGAAMSDTFFTDPVIDWHDVVAMQADTLGLFNSTFYFRNDEFVDVNISSRPTPFVPQECNVPEAPGGMCVEPMFTGISRMDWMRDFKRLHGDPDWPASVYSDFELTDGCGPLGLISYQDDPLAGSVTNGHTYGYFSYKMIEDKPVNRADVYWGFDPYRFDQNETKKAVRWVLEYFGLSINP